MSTGTWPHEGLLLGPKRDCILKFDFKSIVSTDQSLPHPCICPIIRQPLSTNAKPSMTGFQLAAIMAGLTALCGALSAKVFRLKGGAGLAATGAALSLALTAAGALIPGAREGLHALLGQIDFKETLHAVLCFLIFAGAMHMDLREASKWKMHVAVLATLGVALSAFAVAGFGYLACLALGVQIPFAYLLMFGALISPTDPVAVMALLKTAGAPKDLEAKIGAESLFNDGIGLVLFALCVSLVHSGSASIDISDAVLMFLREAFGGLGFGIVCGIGAHYLITSIEDAGVEAAITVAAAVCGYAGAEALHLSAPLAVAALGSCVGHGKALSMSQATREKLMPFWEILDEMLNMALFALVGLHLARMDWTVQGLVAGGIGIALALGARLLSVALPLWALSKIAKPRPGTALAMAWGGLRGGLSLAMALSTPEGPWKATLVCATWIVVMFSLLVQAPTMGKLLRALGLTETPKPPAP